MPCVVTDDCKNCRDCLPTCPVDCFFEVKTSKRVYINASECIECLCCYLVCPHDAILPLKQLSLQQQPQAALNIQISQSPSAKRLKSKGLKHATPLTVQGRSAAAAHRGSSQGKAPPIWWTQQKKTTRRFNSNLFQAITPAIGEGESP